MRWEYLTASMQNFKSGVDSRGGIQVRGGGKSPFPRVLYETLVLLHMTQDFSQKLKAYNLSVSLS